MKIEMLANQLRQRLKRAGVLPPNVADSAPDMLVINSYVTCGVCGKVQLAKDELNKAIESSADAAEFLDLVQPFECCSIVVRPKSGQNKKSTRQKALRKRVRKARRRETRHTGTKRPTVWDTANEWAAANFARLPGKHLTPDELTSAMTALHNEWDGEQSQKYLFLWSPSSSNPLFEVGGGIPRMVMAHSKLLTIATHGGMIFGVDARNGRIEPLIVADPSDLESTS